MDEIISSRRRSYGQAAYKTRQKSPRGPVGTLFRDGHIWNRLISEITGVHEGRVALEPSVTLERTNGKYDYEMGGPSTRDSSLVLSR